MKQLIIIALALCLSGCGSLIQAVNAYGGVAIDNAKATNDSIIEGWMVAACATPISAAMRNPKIIPALKELCPGLKSSGLVDAK